MAAENEGLLLLTGQLRIRFSLKNPVFSWLCLKSILEFDGSTK